MDTTSVGTADSQGRWGATPIFDELVGRYGLQDTRAIVSAPAGEPAVENGTRGEVVAAS